MSSRQYEVIRRPIMSEKNMHRVDTRNQYTFEVASSANKVEIRNAIESLFGVSVTRVNTINSFGKRKRHGAHFHIGGAIKKAIVTLAEGDKIEII